MFFKKDVAAFQLIEERLYMMLSMIYQEKYEEGYKIGYEIGREETRDRIFRLIKSLIDAGRFNDIQNIFSDKETLDTALEEFELSHGFSKTSES